MRVSHGIGVCSISKACLLFTIKLAYMATSGGHFSRPLGMRAFGAS
jgi:hypothetical protein